MGLLENQFEQNIVTTSVDHVFQLGAQIGDVAADVRIGLLRD